MLSSEPGSTSYYERYRRHTPRDEAAAASSTVPKGNLLTDRSAYLGFLEVQLERVSAACLTVSGYDQRIESLSTNQVTLEEKVSNTVRLAQLVQTHAESTAGESARVSATLAERLASAEASVVGLNRENELLADRLASADRRLEESERRLQGAVSESRQESARGREAFAAVSENLAARADALQASIAALDARHAALDAREAARGEAVAARLDAADDAAAATAEGAAGTFEAKLNATTAATEAKFAAQTKALGDAALAEQRSRESATGRLSTELAQLAHDRGALENRLLSGLAKQAAVTQDQLARFQELVHEVANSKGIAVPSVVANEHASLRAKVADLATRMDAVRTDVAPREHVDRLVGAVDEARAAAADACSVAQASERAARELASRTLEHAEAQSGHVADAIEAACERLRGEFSDRAYAGGGGAGAAGGGGAPTAPLFGGGGASSAASAGGGSVEDPLARASLGRVDARVDRLESRIEAGEAERRALSEAVGRVATAAAELGGGGGGGGGGDGRAVSIAEAALKEAKEAKRRVDRLAGFQKEAEQHLSGARAMSARLEQSVIALEHETASASGSLRDDDSAAAVAVARGHGASVPSREYHHARDPDEMSSASSAAAAEHEDRRAGRAGKSASRGASSEAGRSRRAKRSTTTGERRSHRDDADDVEAHWRGSGGSGGGGGGGGGGSHDGSRRAAAPVRMRERHAHGDERLEAVPPPPPRRSAKTQRDEPKAARVPSSGYGQSATPGHRRDFHDGGSVVSQSSSFVQPKPWRPNPAPSEASVAVASSSRRVRPPSSGRSVDSRSLGGMSSVTGGTGLSRR